MSSCLPCSYFSYIHYECRWRKGQAEKSGTAGTRTQNQYLKRVLLYHWATIPKVLVVGVGIEPTLGPNLGRHGYKSCDASNYINPPTGTCGRIRTDTGAILSRLSLPLDYTGVKFERVHQAPAFHLIDSFGVLFVHRALRAPPSLRSSEWFFKTSWSYRWSGEWSRRRAQR